MGSKATKAKPKERLRPGQLDGLVLGYMKKHEDELPITATRVARAGLASRLRRLRRRRVGGRSSAAPAVFLLARRR